MPLDGLCISLWEGAATSHSFGEGGEGRRPSQPGCLPQSTSPRHLLLLASVAFVVATTCQLCSYGGLRRAGAARTGPRPARPAAHAHLGAPEVS